ncbi:hypothetical protein IQ255_14990 [Pleurocapsales cyanobacterium LEGE 10410]|nr:hypothetical protein [Pleurocapsales cyanobacterium LEGE 10410]
MKSFSPIVAILLGIIISQAHIYAFAIKYLLMLMLFFPFLKISIKTFYPHALWIVVANLVIAIAVYLIILPFNSELAFLCLITAITPTATAAPAVMDFLQGNVEYVASSVLLTNSIIGLTIPLLLSWITTPETSVSTSEVFRSIWFVFGIPLLMAQLVKEFNPSLQQLLLKHKNLSFCIWHILLFLATARATHFIIYESNTTLQMIFLIAASSLMLCTLNFGIGKLIGGQKFALEASQSLGQKNTMFAVWLAFTFLNPIVALGPMFYLVYHNLYNSYQLMKVTSPRPRRARL